MPDNESGTTFNEFGNGTLDDLFEEETGTEEAPAASEETPAEQPSEEEAPQEQAAETKKTEVEVEVEVDVTPAEEEPEESGAPEEEQPLIGGKFKSVEAAVLAYENAERLAHQRAREAADFRRRYQELEDGLKQAEPLIRKALAEQQPDNEFDPSDPESVQAAIRAQAEEIVRQQLAPLQAQQEQQLLEQRLQEVQAFRSAHPDALAHEASIVSVVEEYRHDESGKEIFPPTKDNLEIAYTLATRPEVKALVDRTDYVPDPEIVSYATEAADNPALLEVVEANPQFLVSDKGMSFARKLAGMPGVVQSAKANASQAQQQADKAMRAAAHVEKGEAQAPVGAPPEPRDALEEALFEAETTKKSVFG